MSFRIVLTAIAAGFVCTPAIHAQTPARPVGLWARVPALPTACYSSQDNWSEQSTAAFDALQQAHNEQNDINSSISQNATDTFGQDPFAVAARMQQEMMNDPRAAAKKMEQMMQQNQQAQEEAPERLAKEQQIENESKALIKQYEAALVTAMEPGNARLAALTKKYKPMEGSGDLWLRYGDPGEPAWVEPERHAILRQWDQAYVATCPQWWGAAGPFHAYLKRYKDFLVLERIPFEKKGDAGKLEHYRQIGISTEGWRTTTDYDAVEDYIAMAQTLFSQRVEAPRCTAQNPCQ